MVDSVEILGVDLRTRVERLGVKEKARRKKCIVRFSLIKKIKVFQKCYMKVGVKKLPRTGMAPARAWRAHGPERKFQIEEAHGCSSGKKGDDFAVPLLGSIWT